MISGLEKSGNFAIAKQFNDKSDNCLLNVFNVTNVQHIVFVN